MSMNTIPKMNSKDRIPVALKGSTSEEFAREVLPQAKLLLSEDYPRAVEMLKSGKAQVLIADFPICLYSSLRYVTDGRVTLDKPLTYEPIGVALPANDPLLVNWVQNMLGYLEKTGEMDLLVQKWFKDSSWVDRLP